MTCRLNRTVYTVKFAKELQNEKRLVDGIEVQQGSGNVYAGLGLPDAEKLKIKTGLLIEIQAHRPHATQGCPA